MLQLQDHIALENLHATGQSVFIRVLVPLVEHVQLLVGGWLQVFHPGSDLDRAGAAGTIETTGFHFHTRLLACIEEQGAGGNFGGLATGQKRDFGHNLNLQPATAISIANRPAFLYTIAVTHQETNYHSTP